MSVIERVSQLEEIKRAYLDRQAGYARQVLVCGGAGCVSSHCQEVQQALIEALEANGLTDTVQVLVTGCMGTCAAGPVLLVEPDGIFYTKMDPAKVADVVQRHLLDDEVCMEYTFYDAYRKKRVPKLEDISFFREQVRVALRNCGRMEYGSLDAYIARDGYAAIAKAVTSMSPQDVVDESRIPHRREVGGRPESSRRPEVHGVQCRRRRPRRVHGSLRAGGGPPFHHRGHDAGRLRHRRG